MRVPYRVDLLLFHGVVECDAPSPLAFPLPPPSAVLHRHERPPVLTNQGIGQDQVYRALRTAPGESQKLVSMAQWYGSVAVPSAGVYH